MSTKAYQKPQGNMIGKSSSTLSGLEEKRDEAIFRATETLPEALLNIMDSLDTEAAKMAARAFLEHLRNDV